MEKKCNTDDKSFLFPLYQYMETYLIALNVFKIMYYKTIASTNWFETKKLK